MTPAKELLAAVMEHATPGVHFTAMLHHSPSLIVYGPSATVTVERDPDTKWIEVVGLVSLDGNTYRHLSASSAVYSAFLRARGKQQPTAADSAGKD